MASNDDKDRWKRYPYFKDEFASRNTDEDEWWDRFGRMNVDEPTTPEEVSSLRDYINGRTTVSLAAKRFMTLSEEKVPVDGDWDKGARVSRLLCFTALHFPSTQIAILDLVDEIRALPGLEMTEEQKARLEGTWQDWNALTQFDEQCQNSAGGKAVISLIIYVLHQIELTLLN
jgi:hypothetical protein